MKSLLEMANDAPRLSKRDLALINHDHNSKDGKVLGRVGLRGMERMETWGIP